MKTLDELQQEFRNVCAQLGEVEYRRVLADKQAGEANRLIMNLISDKMSLQKRLEELQVEGRTLQAVAAEKPADPSPAPAEPPPPPADIPVTHES